MTGEELNAVDLIAPGLFGDRIHAIVDPASEVSGAGASAAATR
jgi:uncharacterized protein YcbX